MQHPDGQPGHYYVTCRDHRGRVALLLGPFTQRTPGTTAHRQALGAVQTCRRAVTRLRPVDDDGFLSYGTMRAPLDGSGFRDPSKVPTGKLGRVRVELEPA